MLHLKIYLQVESLKIEKSKIMEENKAQLTTAIYECNLWLSWVSTGFILFSFFLFHVPSEAHYIEQLKENIKIYVELKGKKNMHSFF